MDKIKKEILGSILFIIGLMVLISQFSYNPTEEPSISPDIAINNTFGIFGVYVSYYLIKMFLGWGSIVLPIIIMNTGIILFFQKPIKPFFKHYLYFLFLGILVSLWITIPEFLNDGVIISYNNSGLVGGLIARFIHDFMGLVGLIIILLLSSVFLMTNYFNISISDNFFELKNIVQDKITFIKKNKIVETENHRDDQEIFNNKQKSDADESEDKNNNSNEIEDKGISINIIQDENNEDSFYNVKEGLDQNPEERKQEIINDEEEIEIEDVTMVQEGNLDAAVERKNRYLSYKLPSINLLNQPVEFDETASKEVLTEKANHLEHALETFNVLGKVVRISPGPVITLFEIEPAEGVRVNKFTNLSDDLARVMKAQSVRIIAPIPGSRTVGIELPNEKPEIVYMRSILNSEKYIKSNSKLTLAIGRTTSGDAYVYDLAKMPHLLIAGATGAGKSVCINTVIISILYKAKPDEVKFIMIDPKKLELSAYKSLVGYHLITSPDIEEYVMTTADNAVAVLRAALVEMERRYEVFADATVRNISEYLSKTETNSELEKIPYLVVLIDELADLMMTSGRDVEEPITRLAQMARAVGIHLIVATQRPSVDVITGLIKANFPARIAFQVSSKVDSRTIIDQMGAELLLGRGDMLFLPPGKSSPTRLHNALIELDEIEKILGHIENQPKPEEKYLPKARKKSQNSEFNIEGQDELLMDAAKLVIEYQQASVSLLQRKFRIGYSRAGRLVDELESLGIISGYSGSKAREVLVDSSYLETLIQ